MLDKDFLIKNFTYEDLTKPMENYYLKKLNTEPTNVNLTKEQNQKIYLWLCTELGVKINEKF